MSKVNLIEPEEIKVSGADGVEKSYVISKFPCIQGREIIAGYPLSAAPKLGDYKANEEIMLKLMGFTEVVMDDGDNINLGSRVMIDQHLPDWETLVKIEKAMIEYNCSFFGKGKNSVSFEAMLRKALQSIIKTSMDLLQQSSQTDKQPSKN